MLLFSIFQIIESESAYTPDQLEYLKQSFESAFKGVENAYKVLALPKGTKYEEGGKTQKDLDFANLMMIMRDRIIAGFRVPRTALGITDDVNRSNAEATNYVFALRTVKPIMKLITSYLNEFLVPRYGDNLYLDFADPVPEDRVQKMDEMAKATGGAPVLSANEAREKYFGADPVDNGDDVLVPFNFTPLGSPTAPEPTKVHKPGSKRGVKSRYARNAERRQDIARTVASAAAKGISEIFKQAAKITRKARKNITKLNDDEYEVLYKAFALRTEQHEKAYKAALRQDPKCLDCQVRLGSLYFQTGKLAGAAAAYREAIKIDDKNSDAHYMLGMAMFRQGELTKAKAEMLRAIELNPGHLDAINSVATIALRQKDPKLAVDMIGRAVDKNPAYLAIYRTAEAVYAQSSNIFRF